MAVPSTARNPAGNRSFWKKKFARNKARDRRVNRALRQTNWRVFRIWEHELAKKNEARLLRRISGTLSKL